MVFNSFQFWLVYPFLFLGYWLIPPKRNGLRNWYLIIVSYILYMSWQPAFAIILLGVSLITYLGGEGCRAMPRKEILYSKRLVYGFLCSAATAHF